MLEPLVSRLVLSDGGEHGMVLLRSAATVVRRVSVDVPGDGPAVVEQYDGLGRLVRSSTSKATDDIPVAVVAGGFTIVRR